MRARPKPRKARAQESESRGTKTVRSGAQKPKKHKARPERALRTQAKGEGPTQKRANGERPTRKRADGEKSARPARQRAESERPQKPRAEAAKPKRQRAAKHELPRPYARSAAPRPTPPVPENKRTAPHVNEWLFTTREGAEQDLIDELALAKVTNPPARKIAPAVVVSSSWPKRDRRPMDLTFARQGFPVAVATRNQDFHQLVDHLSRGLINKLRGKDQMALHVWVPDSTEANPLASMADELDERIMARLSAELPELKRVDDSTLRRAFSMAYAQVCLIDTERAAAGVSHVNQAPSLARGGRTRVRVTGELPSRAARKLEEALAWVGVSPGPGEVCVDLGAAPGGWTYVLSERRAQVIAVDPAKLRPDIAAKKNVQHLQANAFTYAPDRQVDWLFCDMAYRPLEVSAMLARWGRRRWARMLVANIKLPMTKKAEILKRVRDILEREGEWRHVRAKQLYHDRDEVTITALLA